MKKKLYSALALALAFTSVLGGTMPAHAEGLSEEGDTTTAQTSFSFTTESDNLGGIIISVPETMVLQWDEDAETYNANDSVSAYGYLGSSLQLEIKAPGQVQFSNQDVAEAAGLIGNIDFGDDNTQYWSSEQLYAGVADSTAIDARAVTCAINDKTGIQVGTYTGKTDFTITIVKDNSKSVMYDTSSGVMIAGTLYEYTDTTYFDKTAAQGEVWVNTTTFPNYVTETGRSTLVIPSDFGENGVATTLDLGDTYHQADFTGIDTIVVSTGIKTLASESFGGTGLDGINTVYLSDVTAISRYAFSKLSGLTDVYYAGSEIEFIAAIEAGIYNGKNGNYNNAPLFNSTLHLLNADNEWYEYDWTNYIATYSPEM